MTSPALRYQDWVVREGTTNVLRHSRARCCAFRLRRDGTAVSLDVCDDGVGGGVDGCTPGNGGFLLTARLPLATGGDGT